jgi:16S rRNA (guanine(966)-N(2))-methyltransferase RsmD
MRITGGKAARHIIRAPKGLDVRPTPDLVKQAVFNSLGDRILGARVLELFAGTGALSFESLSRGAISALCVEKSFRHAEVLRNNAIQAGFSPPALQVRVQDAFAVLSQLAPAGPQFEFILADPPYGEKNVGRKSTSLAQQLLDNEHAPSLITAEGMLVLGHSKRDTLTIPLQWAERKRLKHGDSVMLFLSPVSPAPQA